MKQSTPSKIVSTKAIIYCRVSSRKQATEGAGLESQEHRCRDYAEAKGYEVEAVFPDDASGGGDFMKRPGMVALLAYLEARKETNFVIIFDDLKRFARDIEFHKKLRRKLDAYGARPECLNFRFEDTPEGNFVETVIAAQGELEREQNRRQVLQKMRARVEQGFCVFRAPKGYRYENRRGKGKVLVRDEPLASIIQEGLEGFACERFETQGEVRQYLNAHPEFPKPRSGEVTFEDVNRLLTQPLYAGYVEASCWDISRRRGRHEGLISPKTYEDIQTRIKGGAKAPARKDLGETFALRGFVLCADCEKPLYSCESRGRMGKRYPYYLCQTKGCASLRQVDPPRRSRRRLRGPVEGAPPIEDPRRPHPGHVPACLGPAARTGGRTAQGPASRDCQTGKADRRLPGQDRRLRQRHRRERL